MVTHPFHPLRGQLREVLLERRCGPDRVFVCDAGDGRNVELAEDATDRGLVPGERALSFEVLRPTLAECYPSTTGRPAVEPVCCSSWSSWNTTTTCLIGK